MNNGGYLSSHEAAILSCLLIGGELYLLFTSERTSHWAWKALFTCVVYTNFWYKYSGLIFPYTGKIFYICDPAVSVVFSCSDPPLVMTYDFVIGLHSVWHVTKATAQVRLHFVTNSSICFFKVWIFLYDLNTSFGFRDPFTLSWFSFAPLLLKTCDKCVNNDYWRRKIFKWKWPTFPDKQCN